MALAVNPTNGEPFAFVRNEPHAESLRMAGWVVVVYEPQVSGAVSRLEAWADDLMRYADTFDHSPEMVRAVAVEMRAVARGGQ